MMTSEQGIGYMKTSDQEKRCMAKNSRMYKCNQCQFTYDKYRHIFE